MIIAITPIEPPENDKYWAFHFINDSDEQVDSIFLESASYEWGDYSNSEKIGTSFGPLAPGESVEIYRETDTEVRTSVSMIVRIGSCEKRVAAETGKLYPNRSKLPDVPALKKPGKVLELSVFSPEPGTIEIDEYGVRRWLSGGTCESALWDKLVMVEIVTTDEGPFADDVFWVLHEREGGCVIPSKAKESKVLLEKLQALPGFDNAALIKAMTCTDNARFLVWRKK